MRAARQGGVRWPCAVGAVLTIALASACVNSAVAQSAVDGHYAGVMTITKDLAANQVGVFANRGAVRGEYNGRLKPCSAGPFKRILTIRNGQFSFLYNREFQTKLSGSVAADGSLSAFLPTDQGGLRLMAQITGADLAGTVGGAYCLYSLQLRKQT